MVTQTPCGGLTPAELSLVDHVRRGERLDLADNEAVDEAAMRSWDDSRTCRATVIRDILRGRLVADPDPHGVRLRGARIFGRLDLKNLITDVYFELTDCLFEEGVLAEGASMAFVGLTGCRLEHPTEPPMDAAGIVCSVLDLSRVTIIGHAERGAVCLLGAHIGGQLGCDGARLDNDSGPALYADGLQVGQDMYLRRGFTATGSGEGGAVRLPGARIGGQLGCDGARLDNDSGPALIADSLQVGQDMYLRGGFTATGSGKVGAVRLPGAHIGQLECDGARLDNDSGPALYADGLQVGQDMYLRGGFTATGSGDGGAVRLLGAHIGGELDGSGARLENGSGPALIADSLQVGQGMFLTDGFTATGGRVGGTVRLVDAQIGGQLNCAGAILRNSSGPALHAHGVQVRQGMFLRKGFIAIGAGEEGAVRLTGAHIGGDLACDTATLANGSGPGLRAFRLQVDGDVYLTRGFAAAASGDRGAVRLTGATIGGNLDCTGATLRNDSGPALLAYGAQVGQDIYLTEEFDAIGGGIDDHAAVNLRAARAGGAFYFEPKRLKHKVSSQKRLAVDGLTYSGVPGRIRPEDWRELLWHGTPRYTAQPYQQLAAGYRARGDDRQVRQTLMAQRDDQLARTNPRWVETLWGKITKVTLGYGYQPWRALLCLVGVVAISGLLAGLLGAHGALAQTSKTATPGRSCTVIQQVSVGLDLNLPVGTSVARADCDLTKDSASVTADWLTGVGWVMKLLAWVFAALFIAGFTSAVRKT